MAELAAEAGLPAGVLNIVTGSGPEVGEPLGRHPDVDMVSFTGSTATGRRFLNYGSDSNLKEMVLELGGKHPCVVLDECRRPGHGGGACGQRRFLEHRKLLGRLATDRAARHQGAACGKVKAEAANWLVGDPLDPANRVGPLVSKAYFQKVGAYLEATRAETVLMGGNIVAQGFIEPTIVETPRDSKPAVKECSAPS